MEYSSLLKLPCNEYFSDNRLYTMKFLLMNPTELHWHEFYEIEYVVNGTAVETINGVSYPVGPGTLTFLSPVDFHSYQNTSSDPRLYVYKVIFQDVFLPKSLRNDMYAYKGKKITTVQDPSFRNFFKQLYKEYTGDGYAKDIFMMNGIINLAIMVMRALRQNRDPEAIGNVDHSPIQDAIIYVRTHFRENISAEAVAKTVHLSPNYFSEYFKKQTGEKFSVFVFRLRVEYAANLLRVSDISVKEIAYESGFNSASYFSNVFKEYYGMSPEQFRRQNRIEFKSVE